MNTKRADYILQKIEQQGKVRVSDLSEELGCSEVTIRNDIQKLENQGLLKRIHGGAMRVREQIMVSLEPGNILKFADEKERIAQKAFEYINNQDTLVLDESSVNYYLANLIKQDSSKRVVVMTNSLVVAAVLTGCEHVTLFMIGGQISGQSSGKLPSAMGEIAIDTIRKFHADKAFISAHGVNFDVGITSIGSPQLQVKQAILSVVDEVNVLVDSSRFGGGYIMVVCPLERIKRIITDDGIGKKEQELAKEKGIDMEIV